MEIERKYLIDTPPDNFPALPYRQIEQAYLCAEPVIRVRRDGSDYVLTYKSKGLLVREEYNLPLTKEAYEHLLPKADGILLTKKRYLMPLAEAYSAGTGSPPPAAGSLRGTEIYGYGTGAGTGSPPSSPSLTVEIDVFEGRYQGLILAEVEFPTEEEALAFVPPRWFGRDVTFTGEYSNSRLAMAPGQFPDFPRNRKP